MTLPKNITDAIDTLLRRACETLTSAYAMPADEYLRCCTEPARAALEAAIAAAIQPVEPVEPPTDARATDALDRLRERVQKAIADTNKDDDKARARNEWCAYRNVSHWIDDEMRLGRVSDAPLPEPTALERLRERVQKMTNREFFGDSRLVRLGEVLGWIDEERGASHGG